MDEKKYYYLVRNISGEDFMFRGQPVADEVLGPFSAKEMLRLNLPESTPVTDDLENENWKSFCDFDFRKAIRDEHKGARTIPSLILRGDSFRFYFRQDDTEYGPGSAEQMLELELPPDTPVTEDSLDGQWFTAGNFDFQSYIEEERKAQHENHKGSRKNIIAGLVWMIVGISVTVFTYNKASGGGKYIIAWGAILFGFIQFMKGLFGRATPSEEEYYMEDDEEDDSLNEEAMNEPIDISSEELNELYSELGLTPDASDKEVKHAYRVMAKRYHPDRYSSASDDERRNVTARFRNITDAYELIKQLRNLK